MIIQSSINENGRKLSAISYLSTMAMYGQYFNDIIWPMASQIIFPLSMANYKYNMAIQLISCQWRIRNQA